MPHEITPPRKRLAAARLVAEERPNDVSLASARRRIPVNEFEDVHLLQLGPVLDVLVRRSRVLVVRTVVVFLVVEVRVVLLVVVRLVLGGRIGGGAEPPFLVRRASRGSRFCECWGVKGR